MAERYLAVQLRQFFSKPPDVKSTHREEGNAGDWAERRPRVLDALSRADNKQGGKIAHLGDYHLVEGKQTVKSFSDLHGFVHDLEVWLQAVQHEQQPCASILIPHGYFGPDLVFALRHKTDKEKVKLRKFSEDAVNKSSISWACGGRRRAAGEPEPKKMQRVENEGEELVKGQTEMEAEKGTAEQEDFQTKIKAKKEEIDRLKYALRKAKGDLKNMEEENDHELQTLRERLENVLKKDFWNEQPRLSLLVMGDGAKKEKGKEKDKEMTRPDIEHREPKPEDPDQAREYRDQKHEYYACIDRSNTSDLFGKLFATTLAVVQE
ncbi:hypothetical protein ACHAPT_001279 [Fusarium lateritium]